MSFFLAAIPHSRHLDRGIVWSLNWSMFLLPNSRLFTLLKTFLMPEAMAISLTSIDFRVKISNPRVEIA